MASRALVSAFKLSRIIAALVLSLFWISSAKPAVFDFSAPLQDVEVTVRGNTITYRVFDPQRGVWVESSRNHAPGISNTPTNIINTAGVVAWRSANTVWYVIYDPALGSWREGSHTHGSLLAGLTPTDLSNAGGIVNWRFDNTVWFVVYDPQRGAWDIGNHFHTIGSIPTDFRNEAGTITWRLGNTVWLVFYDPQRAAWKTDSYIHSSIAGSTPTDFTSAAGIISWRFGNTVFFAVYDAQQRAWEIDSYFHGSSIGGAVPIDFRNSGGAVAWRFGNTVFFAIYDPQRRTWEVANHRQGPGDLNTPMNLLVSESGTVTWTVRGRNYTRGYDHGAGSWYEGPTLPFAFFIPSRSSGQAPLLVYFIDMSLGGANWNWTFGDGGSSSNRAPAHLFTNAGPFTVTQEVAGASSNSISTSVTIDISPHPLVLQAAAPQNLEQFAMTLEGQVGQRFAVEVSSDLLHWTTLTLLTNSTGSLLYIDSLAPPFGARFYRASLLP